jgi:hypothetical protein
MRERYMRIQTTNFDSISREDAGREDDMSKMAANFVMQIVGHRLARVTYALLGYLDRLCL